MTATIAKHDVRITIGGKQIGDWTNYRIATSLVKAADAFNLTRPFDRRAWDLCKPDRELRVQVDGVALITGYLDDRKASRDGQTFTIAGRDKVGRLADESIPRVDYLGLGVLELVKKLAFPWFTKVTLSNARNRRVLRGKGKTAPAGNEPVRLDTKGGSRLEPGQMRWAAIEELLKQVGWIAWSSGDGTELVVGRPNYEQAVQWRFYRPGSRSPRTADGNVLGLEVDDSVGDRYSQITVVGTGGGTDVNYGVGVTQRAGTALEGPEADGTGGDFERPKHLVIVQDVKSRAEAERYAAHEMARRDAGGHVVRVEAPLHGQRVAGDRLTLFAPDTLARVEDEITGIRGIYLVHTVELSTSRDHGEVAELELVPTGTELAL